MLGEVVATLLDGIEQEVCYKEVRWDASAMPSGVYFYRLEAGTFVEMKKFVLLKRSIVALMRERRKSENLEKSWLQ